jgi:hypothetical protein
MEFQEWIVGEGAESGREYLVRTRKPRCVVAMDEPEETVLAPIVFVNDFGEGFYVEAWLDPEPSKAEHEAILKEASRVLDAFTEKAAQANAGEGE